VKIRFSSLSISYRPSHSGARAKAYMSATGQTRNQRALQGQKAPACGLASHIPRQSNSPRPKKHPCPRQSTRRVVLPGPDLCHRVGSWPLAHFSKRHPYRPSWKTRSFPQRPVFSPVAPTHHGSHGL